MGQVSLDPADGFDEVPGVGVVGFDTGGHREDVGVEDDVFGGESVVGEKLVGSLRHVDLAGIGVCLSLLVEEHHHGGGSVTADEAGAVQKFLLALLQGDGIDDALALHYPEARFEHLPFRRVDHDGYCGDFGLRTHQVEEVAHGFGTVDQAVVHADIDDIGARFDLGAGHRESFLVIFFADQPRELGRAGDVGALADIDEVGFGYDPKLFQPAQAGHVPPLRQGAGRIVVYDLRQFEDVQGRGAAAAAHQIDQAAPHVFLYVGGEHRGRLVVAAHDVRQTRIGIDRHAEFRNSGQPLQVGQQGLGAERAVEAHGQRFGVCDGGVEGFDGLSRQGAARRGECAGDDDRQSHAAFCEEGFDGEDRCLGVQRIEDGFEHQQVGAAVHQAPSLIVVRLRELFESESPGAGVVHVRRHRQRMARRAHRAAHEAGLLRIAGGEGVRRFAGDGCAGPVDAVRLRCQSVVGQRNGVGVERVGRNYVRSGLEVFLVDFADCFRTGEVQQVVAASEKFFARGELLAPVVGFVQAVLLYHRAESAVEQQDAVFEFVSYVAVFCHVVWYFIGV